jgi:hypothetical protein
MKIRPRVSHRPFLWLAAPVLCLLGTSGGLVFAQNSSSPPASSHGAPTQPQASQPLSRITIEVTGGDKNLPVENASVYVKYVEEHLVKDKKLELNVKTSVAGVAHVPGAPAGRVLIQVIAEGWKTYGHWYDITDVNQQFKIHLERPPKWY